MIGDRLRRELLGAGAAVVGFSWVKEVLSDEMSHLARAVSIGVERKLNEDCVSMISSLEKKAAAFLKGYGYRFFCIPPDSDRIRNSFVSKLYPVITHKIAATSSGLGWIGKNGLLISPVFGPRLSLGTVLTDAPLAVADPVETSQCGDCSLCRDHCPSEAITGNEWSRTDPYANLILPDRCRTHKRNSRALRGKPNCGLCVNICPYGRKQPAAAEAAAV